LISVGSVDANPDAENTVLSASSQRTQTAAYAARLFNVSSSDGIATFG
jgi:hypothetical protein